MHVCSECCGGSVEKSYLTGSHTKPPESLHGQMMFREMFYLLSRAVENWDNDVGNERAH